MKKTVVSLAILSLFATLLAHPAVPVPGEKSSSGNNWSSWTQIKKLND
ncbi:hypothetical protein [Effusibacillus lacus]|nr:hypothetical protein [Effusibacillus lacus]TCS72868.1 hypothetical protein EDD64_12084 [Effusibacillus lacus]